MIGVEWGRDSFHAVRLASNGTVRDRRTSARGLSRVANGRFGDALRDEVGPWLAAGEGHVLLAGAIGGESGWVEAPYVGCPADAAAIAAAAIDAPFDWAKAKLVPGLVCTDQGGVPDLLRDEVAVLVGAIDAVGERGFVCLPGTTSRWARIADRQVADFSSWMTGEVRAALGVPGALGRALREPPTDDDAFERGLRRSADDCGLLHQLFGVRTLAATRQLGDGAEAASYVAGLLIGHEVRAAVPRGVVVHLFGPTDLTQLYARAVTAYRGRPVTGPADCVATGLFRIGSAVHWG